MYCLSAKTLVECSIQVYRKRWAKSFFRWRKKKKKKSMRQQENAEKTTVYNDDPTKSTQPSRGYILAGYLVNHKRRITKSSRSLFMPVYFPILLTLSLNPHHILLLQILYVYIYIGTHWCCPDCRLLGSMNDFRQRCCHLSGLFPSTQRIYLLPSQRFIFFISMQK